MLWDYFSLIFKDLKGRKFSSFLTFFAISLGILTIFMIVLISQGFEQSIEKQFEQLGSNRLIIQTEGSSAFSGQARDGLTQNEVQLLLNRPFIKEAHPYVIKSAAVEFQNDFVQRAILGVPLNQEFFEDYNINVEKGRFPKDQDKFGIILGPDAAEELWDKEVRVGSNLYIEERKFKVIGILESLGNPEDDIQIYASIDTIRDIFELEDQVDFIFAVVQENYDVNLAAENVEILLENKLGDDTVEVQTFEQLLKQVNDILGIVQATLGGIALVSLIVGAVGIVNTMFVIITEKTKDIGVMKAIGATNGNILWLYVLQAGVFGFLGAVLGIGLGSIGGLSFGAWAQANGYSFLEITIEPMVVLILLGFGFFVGAVSGFIPAFRASRLSIVETFRK